MKNDKNDVRSRYTKTVIKEGLLRLLQDGPLKSVTVAQLCRVCGVSRGTFYHHFYDVYDVYESIENEFFAEIERRLAGIETYAIDNSFFTEIMAFISDNIAVMKLVLDGTRENALLNRIISYMREKYVGEFTEAYPLLKREEIERAFSYSINGSIAVIVDWVKGETKSTVTEIAEAIRRLNGLIMAGYLKNGQTDTAQSDRRETCRNNKMI